MGLSTQRPEEQHEFRRRVGLPFPLLSDSGLGVTKALRLPMHELEGHHVLKRMVWYCEFGRVSKVFYPVFPPGQSAGTVLRWVRRDQEKQRQRLARMKLPVATPFRLTVNESFYISDFVLSDKPALMEHLKEKDIHFFTEYIPYPYTEEDAESWINTISAMTARQGYSRRWAIRQASDGFLVGSIGLLDLCIGESEASEIGVWLAKPFWSKGIMTAALRAVMAFGFSEQIGLQRIFAYIFANNAASLHLANKVGFQTEGRLRKNHKGQGGLVDVYLVARLREDP